MSIVIENRGSQLIRWCANSTIGTSCPIAGVVMNTTSNLVMAVSAFCLIIWLYQDWFLGNIVK